MLTKEMLQKEINRLSEIIDTETGIWQEIKAKADRMDVEIQAMQRRRARMIVLVEEME